MRLGLPAGWDALEEQGQHPRGEHMLGVVYEKGIQVRLVRCGPVYSGSTNNWYSLTSSKTRTAMIRQSISYDGNRYELVDGVLLVTPAPVPVHQIVAGRLTAALTACCQSWRDVYVASPGEILIRPDLRMQPDIMVFRADAVPAKWEEIREHWLAVEIWSPSSVVYDREIKRDAYLQLGVREVWLVDCERKAVLVSRPEVPRDQLQERSLLWRPPLHPQPAPIDLSEVFRGLE